MVVNRKFTKKMSHKPRKLLGLDLFEPKMDQKIAKINYMVDHSYESTITVNLLWFQLDQYQLKVGVRTPFYELPYQKFWGAQLTGGSP